MPKNLFDRLPTELIISVFDKILDAKCLCICQSVSKQFAAHVLQTQCVSVQISCGGHVPVWPPGIINFLKKLGRVESATIQFRLCNRQQVSKPLVRWKSDSFRFTFVFSESRPVASSDDDMAGIKTASELTMEECDAFFGSIYDHVCDFRLRFLYVKELLAVLPNLKHVSAVDSMKLGSLVLDEDGIASVIKKEKPLESLGNRRVKLRIARRVKSPSPGYVLKNVALLSSRRIDARGGLMEDNEYREAATMMNKHFCFFSMGSSLVSAEIADVSLRALAVLRSLGFRKEYRLYIKERNKVIKYSYVKLSVR